VQATTTGTSTTGAAPTPHGSSDGDTGDLDAEACAAEVRRVSKKGVHALTFTENPAAMGYPSFHDEYWNRCGRRCATPHRDERAHRIVGRLAITAPMPRWT